MGREKRIKEDEGGEWMNDGRGWKIYGGWDQNARELLRFKKS